MTGVVLAGGVSRRMGRSKALVELGGRPLLHHVLGPLGAVCSSVAVVCKASSELPPLPAGTERWDEPGVARHPLAGLAHALERSGEDVLACAVDMPFVDEAALRALVAAGAPAVARADGRLEPLLALWPRCAASALAAAAARGDAAAAVAESLGATPVDVAPETVAGINTPEELAAAERHRRG